jgi:orotidine-5'-phosphate decarboxylase
MSYRTALNNAVQRKNSRLCVGIDPQIENLPPQFQGGESAEEIAEHILSFNKMVIDACAEFAACVKPQIAYYEILGHHGLRCYEETTAYAQAQDLLVIGDAKRGDIGATSSAYARAHLADEFGIARPDSVTVNPLFGTDGIEPFIKVAQQKKKGIYLLVKTSNPSSSEIQDQLVDGAPLYHHVASLLNEWARTYNYDSLGAVIGATHPQELKTLRKIMPETPLLIPGYGAQGGTAENLKAAFNDGGLDAVINSSRGILYAWQKESGGERDPKSSIAAAAQASRDDINSAL